VGHPADPSVTSDQAHISISSQGPQKDRADIPSERSNRKAISATPGPPGATHSLTEGDLITGAQNRSAIGTLVDRTSRYVTLVHLPGGHSADELHLAMKQVITTLPAHAWLTLTWDQGSEMANHHHIATGFPEGIFFADPGSPWQRGSNENTVPAPPILPTCMGSAVS